MKTMQVRFPDPIHERLKELATEDGVSLNSFVVTSVNNEVIRQETRDFFRDAGGKLRSTGVWRGSRYRCRRTDRAFGSNRRCRGAAGLTNGLDRLGFPAAPVPIQHRIVPLQDGARNRPLPPCAPRHARRSIGAHATHPAVSAWSTWSLKPESWFTNRSRSSEYRNAKKCLPVVHRISVLPICGLAKRAYSGRRAPTCRAAEER